MTFFDANTWIGRWPFSLQPALTAKTLVARLKRHAIDRALVSPVEAVFAPEPGEANRGLLRETRRHARLIPVPVIHPGLANWREQIAGVATDPRVRALRLLPNYHGYRLDSPRIDAVVAAARDHGLRLIVTMRLIDERHEYFALRIKGVPVRGLEALLRRNPRVPVLASGLTRSELLAVLPKQPHLLADLSFAEWHETMSDLRRRVPATQLAFASHTPFLVTAAATAKLRDTALLRAELAQVAAGNLEAFLKR